MYAFTIVFLFFIFILFTFLLITFSYSLNNNYVESDIENISYLILTNSLKSTKMSIPSPFYDGASLDIEISLDYPTKNQVQITNSSPYISSNIYIKSKILSKSTSLHYYSKDNLDIVKDFINTYLRKSISSYLYTTSRTYNKDLIGFYKYCNVKDFDWDNNYKNAFFNVNVKTSISY